MFCADSFDILYQETLRAALTKAVESKVDATQKSQRLLVDNLTDSQREEFRRNEEFTVESKGAKFTLKKDITVKDDGTRLCAIAPELPVYDQMLARKLALENAPDLFFSVANNLSAVRRPLYGRGLSESQDSNEILEMVRRIFECQGFTANSLYIEINPNPAMLYSFELTVRYGNYGMREALDADHLAYSNFIEAIQPLAEHMAKAFSRDIIRQAGQPHA